MSDIGKLCPGFTAQREKAQRLARLADELVQLAYKHDEFLAAQKSQIMKINMVGPRAGINASFTPDEREAEEIFQLVMRQLNDRVQRMKERFEKEKGEL